MVQPASVPMCPMAETCKGMMDKPFSGFVLIIPGIVFLILGVLIVIEPRILVWIVAIALVLMGAAMLMLAMFVRRIAARMQRMHG